MSGENRLAEIPTDTFTPTEILPNRVGTDANATPDHLAWTRHSLARRRVPASNYAPRLHLYP
jgi:hypothetical protein